MGSAHNFIDLTGQRFGRLLVVAFDRRDAKHTYWRCRCDCGATSTPASSKLRSGSTVSCGCFHAEVSAQVKTTHGRWATPEHRAWAHAIGRCHCPTDAAYARYGGRGIRVCERWRSFENFLADMGPRPSPKHSLDRYPDNDGNYEPGNCRWATATQQARNRRNSLRAGSHGEAALGV